MKRYEAGPELDQLVAERVLGWQRIDGCWRDRNGHNVYALPPFSRDMGHAWPLVEREVENGLCPALIHDDYGHWALVSDGSQNCLPVGVERGDIATSFFVPQEAWFDLPATAICNALLDRLDEDGDDLVITDDAPA